MEPKDKDTNLHVTEGSSSGFRFVRSDNDGVNTDMTITNPAPEGSPPAVASGTCHELKVMWRP